MAVPVADGRHGWLQLLALAEWQFIVMFVEINKRR